MTSPKLKERDINSGIRSVLELDGWHVFLMETIWRADWRKGTGEPGMSDILAIRYHYHGNPYQCLAEVLWIEGKSERGKLEPIQRVWISAERARGALIWVAGEDFAADVDSFMKHYRKSGLCMREIL